LYYDYYICLLIGHKRDDTIPKKSLYANPNSHSNNELPSLNNSNFLLSHNTNNFINQSGINVNTMKYNIDSNKKEEKDTTEIQHESKENITNQSTNQIYYSNSNNTLNSNLNNKNSYSNSNNSLLDSINVFCPNVNNCVDFYINNNNIIKTYENSNKNDLDSFQKNKYNSNDDGINNNLNILNLNSNKNNEELIGNNQKIILPSSQLLINLKDSEKNANIKNINYNSINKKNSNHEKDSQKLIEIKTKMQYSSYQIDNQIHDHSYTAKVPLSNTPNIFIKTTKFNLNEYKNDNTSVKLVENLENNKIKRDLEIDTINNSKSIQIQNPIIKEQVTMPINNPIINYINNNSNFKNLEYFKKENQSKASNNFDKKRYNLKKFQTSTESIGFFYL